MKKIVSIVLIAWLTGKVQTTLIMGDDKLTDQFTYDQYSNYQPAAKDVDVRSNGFTCAFPSHSFTQIKVSSLRTFSN